MKNESEKATELLKDKVIAIVKKHGESEVCIIFTDGTRFFVNQTASGLELSIT